MIKKLILKDNSGLPLDANKYLQLENHCQKFLCSDEIRFVGVLNNMGNLIAGGFKDGTDPLETDEKRRMQYMQIVFDIAIRKDFDDTLGKVNAVVTYRNNVLMIVIPINNYAILISAKSTSNAEKIIKSISHQNFFGLEV